HRARGQYVLGVNPAGAGPDDRARGREIRFPGAAARLRRRDVLRGAGDHGTLAAPCCEPPAWSEVAGPEQGQPDHSSSSRQGAKTMTEQEILAGLGEIVEEIAGVPADEVTPNKSFVDDLDIDSLSMVEIAVAAQDKFGVEIPDDQLKDLTTVQDVVNYVSKNAGGSA